MKKRERNKELIIWIIVITIIIAISIIPIHNEINDRNRKKISDNIQYPGRSEGCICTQEHMPVCWANGITYWNLFVSICAWQKNYKEWECKTSVFKRIINKLKK